MNYSLNNSKKVFLSGSIGLILCIFSNASTRFLRLFISWYITFIEVNKYKNINTIINKTTCKTPSGVLGINFIYSIPALIILVRRDFFSGGRESSFLAISKTSGESSDLCDSGRNIGTLSFFNHSGLMEYLEHIELIAVLLNSLFPERNIETCEDDSPTVFPNSDWFIDSVSINFNIFSLILKKIGCNNLLCELLYVQQGKTTMEGKQKKATNIPTTIGFRINQNSEKDRLLYNAIKEIAEQKDRSLSYIMKEILKREVLANALR